ncbi:XRE family transcriptional regulator [Branchiibius hedensis]|uniref:Cupin domain-containing protein n=1 Tax=Branchiibius hedensis TaxID=672460 RepID=A0A2Y9C2J7_9MICO|nr:helix-turn-helix domain-containing protein [Branchiibius hedensis]PWJ27393.1 XRE family transcriptional regulator [Branchiibius hedensis]SSA36203.1 Cupin domain-containing protein [Branchiibius hedensis]
MAIDELAAGDAGTSSDTGALEEFDAQLTGMRIREVRERKGLSLREVARRMDISASALSQIERGLLRPSVNRLFAIANALDVTVLEVFGESEATGSDSVNMSTAQSYSLRRSLEMETVTLEGGVSYRRLSPGRTHGVDFFESTYPPHSTAGDMHELNTHTGFEVGTVVSGELTIDFPKERVLLRAGDSISYSCALPHRLSNQSDEPAVATWLVVTQS